MGKLFQVIDKQSYFGQGLENVYWYYTPQNATTSLQMATAFNSQVVANLRNLQSNNLNHDSIYVKEWIGGTDIIDATQTGATAGTQGGDSLPPFLSFGFKLSPLSGNFRQGGKRYAGLTEDNQGDNTLVTGFKTQLALFALQVVANIVIPSISATLTPVIVRVTDSPSAGWLFTQIISAIGSTMSTQNTRKANIGGGPLSFGDGVNQVAYDDEESKSMYLDSGSLVVVESEPLLSINTDYTLAFVASSPTEPLVL